MAGYLRGGSGQQGFRTTQNLQRFVYGPRTATMANVANPPGPPFWRGEGVSVIDFGAVGNGVHDDGAAIQAAIDSLPACGGTVLFPGNKTYLISATLEVGNGSGTAVSTKSGVVLKGQQGRATTFPTLGYWTTYPGCPVINQTASAPIIRINGPLQSWGVENLRLNGPGTVGSYGIVVTSAAYGECRNLSICYVQFGVWSTTVGAMPAGILNVDSLHNTFDNIFILTSDLDPNVGVTLTSPAGVAANTCFTTFSNLLVTGGASTGKQFAGVHLISCDGNLFENYHWTGGASSGTLAAIVFDYTVNPDWPAGNTFNACDPGPIAIINSGTPAGTAKPNYLSNLSSTNGATYPSLANLWTDHGDGRFVGDIYAAGGIAAGNNTTAMLHRYLTDWTALYAPDGSSGSGGILVGTASGGGNTNFHRNETHTFQNRAGSTTSLIIGTGGTVAGTPAGGAQGAGTINATGLYVNGTAVGTGGGSTGLSGMTAGQIPIAATATTITSSGNLSGDVTTSGSLATTLATVNANVGTFQGITVNAKGLVTAAANQSYLTGNQTITVTGDVDGSGTTAIALTLDTVNANVGSFTNANITVNGKGLITAAANGTAGGAGTITAGTAGEVALYTGTTTIDGFVMSGDATISASGVVALTTNSVVTTDITNANVTYAKIQNVANNRILGNTSGSAAAPSEIALPLVVSNGGTGAATLAVPSLPFSPTGGLIICHGTGALTAATNWGQWDNYGLYGIGITGNAPYIEMGASSGTLGSPTATASGQTLGALYFDGYGTAWNSASRATFRALANELWTASAQGTRFEISTTLLTTTTTAVRMTVAAGVTIGAPTGGDKGAGTLNATAVYAAGTLLTSDARLKREIEPLPDCLALIEAIEPKTFKFIAREAPDGSPQGPTRFWERRNWGFLAQDVQAVLPDAVEEDADGNLALSPSDLVAVLWKSVQELSARVAELEARA